MANTILEAYPRGLCAGVARSLKGYDLMIQTFPDSDIYSVGEPAHNTQIVDKYRERGVRFVSSVDEIPDGSVAVFGPHGSTQEDLRKAREKGLTFMDTECPLVTKVKREVARNVSEGRIVIYHGQKGHAEARAVTSVAPENIILIEDEAGALSDEVFSRIPDPNKVAFNSQTTHNSDESMKIAEALRKRLPELEVPRVEDICYATRNRQKALREMIKQGAEEVVVVGSKTSSNSKRLKEVAEEEGALVQFVDGPEDLVHNFQGKVGLTAGASVEEEAIDRVRQAIMGAEVTIEQIIVADESSIEFSLPEIQR